MLHIVLFGPPGAGKGTQSKKLCDKYNLIHLSTGDLLRDEISRATQLGMQAKSLMDKGELVSDEVVIAMIGDKLDANPTAKGFIFDGFPRTQAQAKALDELLERKKTPISMMIALEVNDEELLNRLLLRGADSGRADDRDENVIRRRIFNYNNQTAPLKKYYSEQKKFHSVYGMGSIDDIFELLVATIDNKTQTKKPYYDGMVTVADISVEDEPAKHLKDVFEAIKEKAKPIVTAIKEIFTKKALAKPVKKAASTKKKIATKPIAKKTKVVKKASAKKKAVVKKKVAPKKTKPAAKKSTKKVVKKAVAKKIIKKVIVKKSKAKVIKKSPAKKKAITKKTIKKSSKK